MSKKKIPKKAVIVASTIEAVSKAGSGLEYRSEDSERLRAVGAAMVKPVRRTRRHLVDDEG